MSPPAAGGPIVVVGASLAGVRAAQALRRHGYAGALTLVGAERHWPPFDRPPLSKQVLAGEWDPDRARLRLRDELDADLVLGRRAVSLDLTARQVVLDDGAALGFAGLVIATGASPRSLPGTDAVESVRVLRTVDDALALQARLVDGAPVVVVGAGFIGCEVAATAAGRGCRVTMVEALEWPLGRVLGPEVGQFVAGLHSRHGVELRLGTGVASIEPGAGGGAGPGARVTLDGGEQLTAAAVVVGIGVHPETEWLEGSGVLLDDGVVTDETCAVLGADGDPLDGVVAAGDVARWWHAPLGQRLRVEHWTNAVDQAEQAAARLLQGRAVGPFAPVPYFWSDQHGTKLQMVGVCGPGDAFSIDEGDPADGRFVAAWTRGGTLVGALCVNHPARMVPWKNRIAEEWQTAG